MKEKKCIITNSIDPDRELYLNKRMRHIIVFYRAVLQVICTAFTEYVVLFVLNKMRDDGILTGINSKLYFSEIEWRRLTIIVILLIIIISIVIYVIGEKYICTSETMKRHHRVYSDDYIKAVKILMESDIINIYTDKRYEDVVWFDYIVGENYVKNIGVYMQVLYQTKLEQVHIDFQNRIIRIPYTLDTFSSYKFEN